MIRKIDITKEQVASSVLQLQLVSYAIEAKLICFDALPPLRDTVPTLQQCGETFWGYMIADKLVGAIAYKRVDTTLDIHRLFVHPDQFRQGIGERLLQSILSNEQNIDTVIVATAANNTPAIRFYLRQGFVETDRTIVAEGLELVHLTLTLTLTLHPTLTLP